ncbi:hypothetical protein CAMRE0001_3041 [Campylobacter rectus RM3267]|uniref:Uncharacterized protein n=1 Tax=Campylobacter rectus RM3267 TaxID=553218 RepID=B9D4F3_CAMRE|nr:hypothetical protein CAMRE0001_3041 [Campylobacter rectus RM3267]
MRVHFASQTAGSYVGVPAPTRLRYGAVGAHCCEMPCATCILS